MRLFFYIIVGMLPILTLSGQDVLVLMNGDSLKVTDFTRSKNGKLIVSVTGKKGHIKKLEFYPVEVFSVIKENGKEEILYNNTEENVLGMELNQDNVRMYIQGEAYAKKNYRFIIGKVVNFVAGVVAPFVSTYIAGSIIFAPLLPLAISTIIGYTGPSAKAFDKRFSEKTFNKYFKEGYLVASRVIRINKGIKHGFFGFITGLSGYIIAVKFL